MSSNHLNSAMSYSSTVDTLMRDTTANMKLATMELAEKVMVIEERTIFLGDLVKMRRGTKEVENYVRKQENIRHESKENRTWEEQEEMILREREIVVKSMENKLSDNIAKGARKGRELCQLKRRLLWRLGRDDERRKFTNELRERLDRRRQEVRRDHRNQLREIRIEGRQEEEVQASTRIKEIPVSKDIPGGGQGHLQTWPDDRPGDGGAGGKTPGSR